MKVGKDKVVSVYYSLKDTNGEVLDESLEEAVQFLFGSDDMIPGLEQGLEGKEPGDKINLDIKSEDAYGAYEEGLVQTVKMEDLEGAENLEEGAMLEGEDEDGEVFPVVVSAIENGTVTLDGNHPLAGIDLNFSIEIVSVRSATQEEIDQGRVHDGSEEH